jgi:two-component system sensor histidine kinase RegB
MTIDLEPAITLPWLIRLRWLFVIGQVIAFPVARLGFSHGLAWWPFALAVAVIAISNVALAQMTRRGRSPAQLMGGVLILDTAVLTIQLAALGGATNPFTVFYLVYITLSSVVLSARWTTAIAALAVVCYALLFAAPSAPHVHHDGPPILDPHLQGMWAAFVAAALLTAFFIRRISRAIASQREQIATLRETAARNARLASLATLAAGAAHELNSPLSTIAVAAHEASLHLGKLAGAAHVTADLTLILEEVDRCQLILHQMAARAAATDPPEAVVLGELVARIRGQLGEDRERRLEVRHRLPAGEPIRLPVPMAQLVQAVVALIKNALDASAPAARVVLEIERTASGVAIAIQDTGTGIAADVLAKVGEPFFTTKQPGRGLGLGVFLARVLFESLGGGLAIDSTLGAGTRVVGTLPIAGRAPEAP